MEPIMADDPKAIEKLQEKLASMEASRDKMKLFNKMFKKALKRAEVDKSGNVADYLGAFAKEAGQEISHETCVKMVALVEKAYSWEKQPYPPYRITNLGANIRTTKKRIEQLEVVATEETSEYELNGVRVVDNVEDLRLQLFFEGKPDKEIRTKLKQSGFRWTPSIEAWQSYRGSRPNYMAKSILESLGFDCDNCKQHTTGEIYQDKDGQMFVCQECFNAPDQHDDMWFTIPAEKTDFELQQK